MKYKIIKSFELAGRVYKEGEIVELQAEYIKIKADCIVAIEFPDRKSTKSIVTKKTK